MAKSKSLASSIVVPSIFAINLMNGAVFKCYFSDIISINIDVISYLDFETSIL